ADYAPRAPVLTRLLSLSLLQHGHVADRTAPDDDRFHMRNWRQHAGPPDVARDLLDLGLRLLRRVLERDRPAGRARDEAELELLRKGVDLDHHAVDLVLELVPAALPLAVILDDLVDRVEPASILVHSEAHGLERAEHVPLC